MPDLTFDKAAAAYDRFMGRWSRLYIPGLISALQLRPGDRVLEVGAGPGRFTIELARLGARILVSDISAGQLDLNRAERFLAALDVFGETRVRRTDQRRARLAVLSRLAVADPGDPPRAVAGHGLDITRLAGDPHPADLGRGLRCDRQPRDRSAAPGLAGDFDLGQIRRNGG